MGFVLEVSLIPQAFHRQAAEAPPDHSLVRALDHDGTQQHLPRAPRASPERSRGASAILRPFLSKSSN